MFHCFSEHTNGTLVSGTCSEKFVVEIHCALDFLVVIVKQESKLRNATPSAIQHPVLPFIRCTPVALSQLQIINIAIKNHKSFT
mmetsp:Transcript_23545/g.58496  ORF Transcript_23545/g.58496 Transcript_23545/m.58496 type:complete len:84 (-) Transcript_23545:163-414(-)